MAHIPARLPSYPGPRRKNATADSLASQSQPWSAEAERCMLGHMVRVICAVLGTVLLAVRACILGAFGVGAVLCAGYSLYWLLRHGGLPDMSLASLYPGVYEYLLPPRYIVLNTTFIYCVKLPLIVLLGLLFCFALLLDKLGQALFRWLEMVLRADKAI